MYASDFVEYGRDMTKAIETMRKVVYAFYDEKFSFKDLIMKGPNMRSDLTNCWLGNVLGRSFESLFESMSELVELPSPSPHGLSMADTPAA